MAAAAAATSHNIPLCITDMTRTAFELIRKKKFRDLGNYPSTLRQRDSFAQRESMGRSSRIHLCRLDHVNYSRRPTLDCPQNVQSKIRHG